MLAKLQEPMTIDEITHCCGHKTVINIQYHPQVDWLIDLVSSKPCGVCAALESIDQNHEHEGVSSEVSRIKSEALRFNKIRDRAFFAFNFR